MNHTLTTLALVTMAGLAHAQATVELLPIGYVATDLSSDGNAAAGNVLFDNSYETFRWTAATGAVRLGRASVPEIGRGAGTPDISHDGKRVSASILSSDTRLTQGLWDVAAGWVETMPPPPADGVNIDETYGSAWGLSGDGSTLTGFYWNPRARACTWSAATGIVALPQNTGRSARVNAANFDGTVVVGWEEINTGEWQPRAWRSGVKFELETTPAFKEAEGVNSDGSIIVGQSWDASIITRVAAIWRWNGSAYTVERLGYLPGTVITRGQALISSISDDGLLAVGYNQFTDASPASAGIVWTPSTGLMNATDYVSGLGITLPAGLQVIDMPSVSPDGTALLGLGLNFSTGQYQSFIIHLPPPPAPCNRDINGDHAVNTLDLTALLGQFGQSVTPGTSGDFNGDGVVNVIDLTIFLGAFGDTCE